MVRNWTHDLVHPLIKPSAPRLVIDTVEQKLYLLDTNDTLIKNYQISTAKRGLGEKKGSFQTPRGLHVIRAKIGENAPRGAVFVARRQTGEIYRAEMSIEYPERDWILTRILWLCGCEPNKNRFGDVDSMRRYIYLHGVPDEASLSSPRSKGCINLQNDDMIDLFNRVQVGSPVLITDLTEEAQS
jgi:L,D-transpeptidase YbiS